MNNFKNSINKIEMDKNEKAKILNNILEKNHKEKHGLKHFVLSLSTFILAFTLLCGSGYALVKYLKIDQKILNYLNLSETESEKLGISGNEENITKNYDNLSITIKNTVFDNNNIIILFDVKNPNNVEFRKAYLSLGDNFDNENGFGGAYSFNPIETNDDITTYIYKQSLNTTVEKGNMTLSLLECLDTECDKTKFYDITFPINYTIKNKKEFTDKNKTLLFKGIDENNNEANITLNKIYLSPLSARITIKNSDKFNYEFNINNATDKIDVYILYNDNSKINLNDLSYNIYTQDTNLEDSTSIDIFYEFNNAVDVNNIKSIVINDIEFKF